MFWITSPLKKDSIVFVGRIGPSDEWPSWWSNKMIRIIEWAPLFAFSMGSVTNEVRGVRWSIWIDNIVGPTRCPLQ